MTQMSHGWNDEKLVHFPLETFLELVFLLYFSYL